MGLAGTVSATLKADASQWTSEIASAAKALGNVKATAYGLGSDLKMTASKNDALAKSLSKTTYAAKENEEAAKSLRRATEGIGHGAESSHEKLESLARGMRFSVSAILTAEGQLQHAGHALVGLLMGAADPVMLLAMGAGFAIEALAKHFEHAGDAAEKSTQKAEESLQKLRTEVQNTDDALKALGRGVDVGRITAERDVIEKHAIASRKAQEFKETYGDATENGARIESFRAMEDTSDAAQKVVAAYDDVVASALELGLAQKKLADTVAHEQLKEHLESEKKAASAVPETVGARSLGSVLNGLHDVNTTNRISDEMLGRSEALRSIHRMYKSVADTADASAAADEAARAEDEQRKADAAALTELELQAQDAQREFLEKQRAFAEANLRTMSQGVGTFGASVVGGHGGSTGLGAIGSAAGMAVGAAVGDPTGIAGGMIGGALGNAIGDLVDKLEPLGEAGGIVMDAFADVVAEAKPLFEPLVFAAKALKTTLDATLAPYAGKLDRYFGAVGRTLLAFADAAMPLLGLFIEFNPVFLALAAGCEAFAPAVDNFANSVELAAVKTFEFANEIIRIADYFGAHMREFDTSALVDHLERHCFTARTVVATPRGPRRIDELAMGDLVVGRDEKTGEQRACTVASVLSRMVGGLVIVEIDEESIETTAEHPFWVAGSGWTRAGDLVPGDQVRKLDNTWSRVRATRVVAGGVLVYNLTVDETHTFFVGAGGIWVHNKDAEKEALKAAQEQAKATDDNTEQLKLLNRRADNLPLGEKVLRGAEFAAATPHVSLQVYLDGKQILNNSSHHAMVAKYGSIFSRVTRMPDNKN